IRRCVRLKPSNIIKDVIIQSLESVATLIDGVIRSAYPKCPVRLKHATACLHPAVMKIVIILETLTPVPIALVYAHHSSRMYRKSVVRKIVRGIRKDHVN